MEYVSNEQNVSDEGKMMRMYDDDYQTSHLTRLCSINGDDQPSNPTIIAMFT